MTTPLQTTYDQIWAMLNAKSDFVALFPLNTPHQVVYDTVLTYAPEPDLDELAPADYPRCRVIWEDFKPETETDSDTSYLAARFTIEVCTGQQVQAVLMNATWAIYRAMLGWRQYVKQAVTWEGQDCILDVNAESLTAADKNADWGRRFLSERRDRGTEQWLGVWGVTVRMYFNTAALQAA